ncbi:taxadiene 5-alpha hydroxylase-like [Fagus crenata]
MQNLESEVVKMPFLILIAFTLISAFLLSKYLSKSRTKNLPKGSLGYPLIGETLGFLRAQTQDRGQDWIDERILKHGSVFKTSLMGSPTVVIIGKAGNKFILGAEDDVFAAKQPVTAEAIFGKESILELTGFRYRMVKGAMMSFLKPESLQNYLKEMDELVKRLLLIKTKETDTIKAVTFMKKLTFTIAFNILFGIKDECTRDALFEDFNLVFKAIWSLPVNFPGTVYWRGLKARSRIVDRILPILRKKNEELSSGILSPTSDVISSMLALRDQNQQPIGHHAIIDNCITLVIASHDTSTILISLMIWKLARDPEIYKKVLEGGILWLHINAIVIQAVYLHI